MTLIWRDRRCFNNSRVSVTPHSSPSSLPPSSLLPRAFSERTNPFRSISIFTHRLRVCAIAAARRMAAKGYRCTSNYDQCVPFDLTTLFSPPRSSAGWQVQSARDSHRDNLNKMVVGRRRRMGANKTLLIYTRFSPQSDFSQCYLLLFTLWIFHPLI